MPRLSEEKLQQIRSSVDIVDVIGNYLPLHKKGKGYWAVCPFHDDKNPSMSVSQELQIYKCFVCNAGGNVFTFLKDYLKISYIEAVKMCAEMAGIDVPELNSYQQEKKIDDKLVPLYQMHSEASKIYQLFLDTKPALKARDYLLKRHLDERVIKEFQIGYAPNDDSLKKAFTQLNFSPLDMARSGLVVEGKSGYYDRFKERIVFPLWDSNGQVIGFSGRIYLPDEQQAKYMNSPESEIFTKGDMLYHYAQSKSAIKKEGFVYLLEGFMDVIALYRAGLENAVALMGTALTKSHLTLLRKVTDTIYLCLDGDRPGLDAMSKASQVLLGAGFKVRIICLPQGMDPDELLENFGQEALINALNKHISVLEFKINDEYEKIHKDNYEERRSYLEKIAMLLCQVEDEIDLDYYIDLVSIKSGFSRDIIFKRVSSLKNNIQKKEKMPIISHHRPKQPHNKYAMSEAGLLYYMLLDRNVATRYESELGFLYDDKYRLLANYIIDYYHHYQGALDIAALVDFIGSDEALVSTLFEISELTLPKDSNRKVIDDYIATIKKYSVKLQIEDLKAQMAVELDENKKSELAMKMIELQCK